MKFKSDSSHFDVSGPTVAVVGLGYVGLPTALALCDAGATVIGVDSSPERLRDIARGAVDLLPLHHAQLACASAGDRFRLTPDATAVRDADAVVICVPTPSTPGAGPTSPRCPPPAPPWWSTPCPAS